MTARGAVALRPATADDAPFLERLYASTRDDLLALPLPVPARTALVAQQHRARTQQHAAAYPDASSQVVELDGVAVGRLAVDHAEDELRVVDVALLPEHRGRGIGTTILRSVLARADDLAVPVTLQVAAGNPAQRLYGRLGFRPTADAQPGDGPAAYLTLLRPPREGDGQAKTAS
ncbi:GNAT family N-acetyltransferase [Patulibacter americanus]|uniref:GNAT family N-acetyltransferase n=1 Tax=Patulibacter americanus TaxID=588672 RepID=UPI0003B39556|nr:GNAT family N-acetyltransferase [Patulibacter americanus]